MTDIRAFWKSIQIQTTSDAEPQQATGHRNVAALSGLGKASIYDGVAAGTFPASLKIGPRAVGRCTSDLTQWLNDRMGAR